MCSPSNTAKTSIASQIRSNHLTCEGGEHIVPDIFFCPTKKRLGEVLRGFEQTRRMFPLLLRAVYNLLRRNL